MKKVILSLITAATISVVSAGAKEVYATVNGEDITKEDIAVVLRNPQINFDTLPKQTQEKVINQLIEKKLLEKEAIDSGVRNSQIYKDALAKISKDLALEVWMQEQFKAIKVSDKEIKDFYSNNTDKFQTGVQLKARHILVKTEKEARDIIKTLNSSKDKKAKFIELAKSKSTGPTGKNGGDLGWFEEKRMVPEFSAAARALNKDTFTKDPVKTQFGYHVIYLEDKKEAKTVKLDEVKEKIKQAIVQEKFRIKIKSISDNLRKKAKIVNK